MVTVEGQCSRCIQSVSPVNCPVSELKTQIEDLRKIVASNESLNIALTKKTEEIVQINTYIKGLEAYNKNI